MKAIILAAGYATRLYPLTTYFPKSLLKINKKPMINHIMEKLAEIGVKDVYVITNNKFFVDFQTWAKMYGNNGGLLKIISDKTFNNDDRLGALGDVKYVIDKERIDDDLIVIAGDNLFKFSLKPALELFRQHGQSTIIGYDVKEIEAAKKFGVISIGSDNKLLDFEEKPEHPKSTVIATAVYFYPKKTVPLILKYLAEGNNKDQPGRFIPWLMAREPVYALKHEEEWFDVGSFESLAAAKTSFGEANVNVEKLRRGIF